MPDEYHVQKVPKEDCAGVLKRLRREGRLDASREFIEEGGYILIPVTEGGEAILDTRFREVRRSPYQRIKERLKHIVKEPEALPDRWEKIGDVVLIKLPDGLVEDERRIGEAYAEILGAKSVLLQGEIEGQKRKPEVELIYGEETETVHVENGVKFKMDVSEIMFSSGNIDERMRMADMVDKGERVVDMFAGIGYFSLPIAVHCEPESVHAIDINPTAVYYLKQNIELNGVVSIVEPWQCDNEDFSLDKIADRVIMGYLHETWRFLPKALDILKENGVIHYHSLCKASSYPHKIEEDLEKTIEVRYEIEKHRKVKSYAPHIYHVVTDISVG